jgi:ribosomal protein L37AE/L43A
VYDEEMRAGESCPICGAEAKEFDFVALGMLLKEKWGVAKLKREERNVKRAMRRVKFCPRCGSTDVFWASGLPQLWSIWECRRCGYRGPIILEDSEMAAKLRESYSQRKASQ